MPDGGDHTLIELPAVAQPRDDDELPIVRSAQNAGGASRDGRVTRGALLADDRAARTAAIAAEAAARTAADAALLDGSTNLLGAPESVTGAAPTVARAGIAIKDVEARLVTGATIAGNTLALTTHNGTRITATLPAPSEADRLEFPAWQGSTAYLRGQLVLYDGDVFLAKGDLVNQVTTPDLNTIEWWRVTGGAGVQGPPGPVSDGTTYVPESYAYQWESRPGGSLDTAENGGRHWSQGNGGRLTAIYVPDAVRVKSFALELRAQANDDATGAAVDAVRVALETVDGPDTDAGRVRLTTRSGAAWSVTAGPLAASAGARRTVAVQTPEADGDGTVAIPAGSWVRPVTVAPAAATAVMQGALLLHVERVTVGLVAPETRLVPDPTSEADGRMLHVASGALAYRDAPTGGGGPAGADGVGDETLWAVTDGTTPAAPDNTWGYRQPSGAVWMVARPSVDAASDDLWAVTRRVPGAPAVGAAVADTWTTPARVGHYGRDGTDGQDGADGDTHVPDPTGQADGRILHVQNDALVYRDAPTGGAALPAGRLVYRGAWSGTEDYAAGDVVVDGSLLLDELYLALRDVSATFSRPSGGGQALNWKPFGDGHSPTNNWSGGAEWSSSATYAMGGIARRNGHYYVSQFDGNQGFDPATSGTFWRPLVNPRRLVPDPGGETDGRILQVASGALAYADAPAGGGGGADGIGIEWRFTRTIGTTPPAPDNAWTYGQTATPWTLDIPNALGDQSTQALWITVRRPTGSESATGQTVMGAWSTPSVITLDGQTGPRGLQGAPGDTGDAGLGLEPIFARTTGATPPSPSNSWGYRQPEGAWEPVPFDLVEGTVGWWSIRFAPGNPQVGDQITAPWSTPARNGRNPTDAQDGADGADGAAGVGTETWYQLRDADDSLPAAPSNSDRYAQPASGSSWVTAHPTTTESMPFVAAVTRRVLGQPSAGDDVPGAWGSVYYVTRPGARGPEGQQGPAFQLTANSVTSSHIDDGTIQNIDIANNTISSSKILNRTIANNNIGDGQINSRTIENNSILVGDLSTEVTTRLLATGGNTGQVPVRGAGSTIGWTDLPSGGTPTLPTGNMRYRGNWASGTVYAQGDVVRDSGSLWAAVANNLTIQPVFASLAQWVQVGNELSLDNLLMRHQGDWATAQPYVQGDVVRRENVYYVARSSTTGNSPENSPTQWGRLASPDGAWFGQGAWDATETYVEGAVVRLTDTFYVSRTTNTNRNPATNSADWHAIGGGGATLPTGNMVFLGSWANNRAYPQGSVVENGATADYYAARTNITAGTPLTNTLWRRLTEVPAGGAEGQVLVRQAGGGLGWADQTGGGTPGGGTSTVVDYFRQTWETRQDIAADTTGGRHWSLGNGGRLNAIQIPAGCRIHDVSAEIIHRDAQLSNDPANVTPVVNAETVIGFETLDNDDTDAGRTPINTAGGDRATVRVEATTAADNVRRAIGSERFAASGDDLVTLDDGVWFRPVTLMPTTGNGGVQGALTVTFARETTVDTGAASGTVDIEDDVVVEWSEISWDPSAPNEFAVAGTETGSTTHLVDARKLKSVSFSLDSNIVSGRTLSIPSDAVIGFQTVDATGTVTRVTRADGSAFDVRIAATTTQQLIHRAIVSVPLAGDEAIEFQAGTHVRPFIVSGPVGNSFPTVDSGIAVNNTARAIVVCTFSRTTEITTGVPTDRLLPDRSAATAGQVPTITQGGGLIWAAGGGGPTGSGSGGFGTLYVDVLLATRLSTIPSASYYDNVTFDGVTVGNLPNLTATYADRDSIAGSNPFFLAERRSRSTDGGNTWAWDGEWAVTPESEVEYSIDGVSWHTTHADADRYVRYYQDNGTPTPPIPLAPTVTNRLTLVDVTRVWDAQADIYGEHLGVSLATPVRLSTLRSATVVATWEDLHPTYATYNYTQSLFIHLSAEELRAWADASADHDWLACAFERGGGSMYLARWSGTQIAGYQSEYGSRAFFSFAGTVSNGQITAVGARFSNMGGTSDVRGRLRLEII